jgi:hypothetical protein
VSALRLYLHFVGATLLAGVVLCGTLVPVLAPGMTEGEAGVFGVLLGLVAVGIGTAWALRRESRS